MREIEKICGKRKKESETSSMRHKENDTLAERERDIDVVILFSISVFIGDE